MKENKRRYKENGTLGKYVEQKRKKKWKRKMENKELRFSLSKMHGGKQERYKGNGTRGKCLKK